LRLSHAIQRQIPVALHAQCHVPVRLSVADQANSRHSFSKYRNSVRQ
jgi:hypothetical protein